MCGPIESASEIIMFICETKRTDDELLDYVLSPSLLAFIADKDADNLFNLITDDSTSLSVLRPSVASALATEVLSRSLARIMFTSHTDEFCPACARVGSVLSRVVLPLLLSAATIDMPRLLPSVSANYAVRMRVKVEDPPTLCPHRRVYVLRYCCESREAVDSGRVFRCHVDDGDLTLAICLGKDGEEWEGADLRYVQRDAGLPRSGTPDLNEPGLILKTHKHASGIGVLHGGDAYHFVSPMVHGERATLVIQAMVDDGTEWKHNFFVPRRIRSEAPAAAPG